MNLCDPQTIRAILARHGFAFTKALGQHFITSQDTVEHMARACGAGAGVGVLEIGPGLGPLTRALSLACGPEGKVLCLELDKTLQPVLAETLADCANVTVLWQDALSADCKALAEEYFKGKRAVVCANLPYQITSPLLEKLLKAGVFSELVLMVQWEVAQRLTAKPGTKEYGAFTVSVQNVSESVIIEKVPAGRFVPRPRVDSAVLHMTVTQPVCTHPLFSRVVRAAFAQRRKTLANNLRSAFSLTQTETMDILTRCGLDPMIRGERLSIAEFWQVCLGLEGIIHDA